MRKVAVELWEILTCGNCRTRPPEIKTYVSVSLKLSNRLVFYRRSLLDCNLLLTCKAFDGYPDYGKLGNSLQK